MKINVLELVNSLNIGGLEKVVLEILNFKSIGRSNINYSLCCLEQVGMLGDNIPSRIKTIALNKADKNYFTLIYNLIRFCIKYRIRIIHCHNYAPLLFAVMVKIVLLGRIKIVYTEHNQIYSISSKHLRIFKRLIRLADYLAFVSEDLQNYFLQNLLNKRSADSYGVIWNGIKYPQYDSNDCKYIISDLKIKKDNFIIGTAVVMSKQKALHNLIKAAPSIIKDFPFVKFLMVGDGPLRADLEDLAASKGVKDDFLFVGYKKQIGPYLEIMDLFILPSLWEGFSIVLLEASSLGLPIIATDVGGNREIVIDRETGLIIEPDNPDAITSAVRELIERDDLRDRFSKQNKSHFQNNFLVDAMVKKYENVFQQYPL